MNNSQARVEEVFAEAARLFENKNRAYGDSWRQNGWRGNISRIFEKAGRLRNMLWRGGNVLLNGGNEHPRETMLDMLNTLAFAIINMEDNVEWGHEPQSREIYPSHLQGPSVPRDRELEQFQLSYGNTDITREDMERMRSFPEGPTLPRPAHNHPFQSVCTQGCPQHPGSWDEGADEQTVIAPVISQVPTPGEENTFEPEAAKKPSPKPRRVAVTDKGSGPRQRPVKDQPQA